jgi:pimeloyl-ACP methyl ester carboxylesterase
LLGSDSIAGIFKQAGQEMPLQLSRVKGEIHQKLNRPQEPKAPFPYTSKDVVIKTKTEGVKLAGTLTIPEGKGPFPAVVLVSGSGPQNRNEELMGHKPFLVIADYLTRNGIAVLRYDDRGTAESTGDFNKATSLDFSNDAEAAFLFLQQQKKIIPSKVGIIGHSEGGMIAPMVAARNPEVGFVVLLAGPGIPIDQLLALQIQKVSEAEGNKIDEKEIQLSKEIYAILKANVSNETARKQLEIRIDEYIESRKNEENAGENEQLFSAIDTYLSTWFRYFIQFDPYPYLSKTKCPVLAINGENDVQVTAKENLTALAKILKESGNNTVEIHSLPKLNHLFQHSETGAVSEYVKIEETFSVEVLELMKQFILR